MFYTVIGYYAEQHQTFCDVFNVEDEGAACLMAHGAMGAAGTIIAVFAGDVFEALGKHCFVLNCTDADQYGPDSGYVGRRSNPHELAQGDLGKEPAPPP